MLGEYTVVVRLEVRDRDGSPSESDGSLYFVDQHCDVPLGVFVMSGDDTDPPTRYEYEAELFALDDRLVVRLRQYKTLHGERSRWFVSDDLGRCWREAAFDPVSSDARCLHVVRGKLEPNLLGTADRVASQIAASRR